MKTLQVVVTVLLLWVPGTFLAQQTQIKLATFVPAQSIWDKALRQMGADWRTSTNGRLSLTIFPGGSQGNEADVVRRMRFNQLQAAALTLPGLSGLEPAFKAFGIPFLFDSDEEFFYVLEKLTPLLRERLEERGLVLLAWGHGGWVHFFTKDPVRNIDDLRQAKLFTSAGDDEMVQWYKRNGFNPVALALTDVTTGLQTGLIDAYPSPPYMALLVQWYRSTQYMLDIALAPVLGATVVTRRTWDTLSADDRTKMIEAARAAEKQLAVDVPIQDREAVIEMQKRGLIVTNPEDASAEMEFRSYTESLVSTMRGDVVPADVFDMVMRERGNFRSGNLTGSR